MNELNRKVVDIMIKLQKQIKEVCTFEIKKNLLTITQFQALLFIKGKRNVQMKDIANYFSVTMPTATSLIDKLIRENLVLRKNDSKDRRITNVSLTKLGEKLLKDAVKQKTNRSSKLLSNLNFKEKSDLFSLLSKIA